MKLHKFLGIKDDLWLRNDPVVIKGGELKSGSTAIQLIMVCD